MKPSPWFLGAGKLTGNGQTAQVPVGPVREERAATLRKAMISDLTTEKIQLRRLCAGQEDSMQQGSVIMSERKHGPAVWQFRWSETGAQGQRVYRKRVVGTVEEYPNSEAVREAFKGLIVKPASVGSVHEAFGHDGG